MLTLLITRPRVPGAAAPDLAGAGLGSAGGQGEAGAGAAAAL